MTAATVPQIVPGTLTGDLDITSFTVEHYPGDALGIAVRAPRMNWTYSHTVPEDAQILLTLTRRVPGSKPREEKTYLPADDGVLVPWQFEPLVSREEVFATVQAVSASHKPLGAVSRTLHFEAGLFEEFDHVADFVGPSWLSQKATIVICRSCEPKSNSKTSRACAALSDRARLGRSGNQWC